MSNGQIDPAGEGRRVGFLEKLGLHRPELRAWALYDFGNSAFMTVVITAVFPVYYGRVASAGIPSQTSEFRFSVATTFAMLLIAVLAPLLGTLADFRPMKKRMIGIFLGVALLAVAGNVFCSNRRVGAGFSPVYPGQHRS